MAETEQSRDKTEFLELIKPKKTEYFDVKDQNTNSDILDAKLKEHKDRMDSQSKSISEHQSFIDEMTGIEIPPKSLTNTNPTISFDINNSGVEPILRGSGSTVTNLISYIGQFADESSTSGRAVGWTVGNMFGSVPTFSVGKQSISSTTESTGNSYLRATNILESGNYYFYAGTVESDENAKGSIGVYFDTAGGTFSESVTGMTKRVGVKFSATEENYNILQISNDALAVESAAVFSKMALYKITESEYNQFTVDSLLEKYPYVIGTRSLSDVEVEIRGENLLSVDNPYIYDKSKVTVRPINTGVELDWDSNAHLHTVDFFVPTIVGEKYYINFDSDNDDIGFQIKEVVDGLPDEYISGKGVFTAKTTTINVRFYNNSSTNATSARITNLTLTKGETAPTQYIEPYKQLIFTNSDEHFSENDSFEIKNGKMIVERKWSNPIVLDGDAKYEWFCLDSQEGFKRIRSGLGKVDSVLQASETLPILTKYNGKNIINSATDNGADILGEGAWNDIKGRYIAISVNNNDSGWGEDYVPSDEEVQAYLNGWTMGYWDGNAWSLYANQNGDDTGKRWIKRYQGSGTKATLDFGTNVELGSSILDICPKEKAYGDITECYTLQYELAEPETYEVDLWGTPILPEGKCHVTILSGIRKEKANPVEYTAGSVYRINNRYVSSLQNNNSLLSKTAYKITKIYRILNGEFYDDTDNWKILFNDTDNNNVNGSAWAQIDSTMYKMRENEGINDYYVIYQTLSQENNAGLYTAELTYTDDAQSVVNELGKTLANTENELEIAKAQLKTITEVETYEPTLLNGWNCFDETSTVQVTRRGQTVQIRGRIKGGTTNTAAFTLPEGCEPKETIRTLVPAMATGTTFERLDIESSGSVKVHLQGDAPTWVSVDVDFEVGV